VSGFEARRKFFEQEIENAQPTQQLIFQRPRRGESLITVCRRSLLRIISRVKKRSPYSITERTVP